MSVEPSPERDTRYIVRFDEYAVLDPQPVVWSGACNPIWYVDDIRELGVDPDKLKWHPVPKSNRSNAAEIINGEVAESAGLTFDEARAGLAITYRVPAANIEIIIRG
jgi:hypothetical protein